MSRKRLASKLVNLMIESGIGQDSAVLYEFILSQEFVTNDVIESKFGQYDIRQGIENLLELRIIAIDVIRDKYVLYAINPDLAWGAIANEMTWHFMRSPEDYRSARSHTALPSDNRDIVKHARNLINVIRETAVHLYESSPAIGRHRWREALDRDHLAVLLSETILDAKNKICCVSKPPRLPQLSIIWESIVQSMKRGVSYQRVANLTEVIEHGLYIIKRDVEDYGVDLRVLDLADISHKFYLIDSKYLVVYHLTGPNRGEQVGRMTRERNTINRYRKRFSAYWEQSIPGLFVVQQLRDASYTLLEKAKHNRFDEAGLMWLECLINWGIFCNLEYPAIAHVTTLEKQALDLKLARYGTTGKLVPNYDIGMQKINQSWQASRH